MPGPVSDSYDPEFSTRANAGDVRAGIEECRDLIGQKLGPKLLPIVNVAQGAQGKIVSVRLSERQRRLIRFALNRAIESI